MQNESRRIGVDFKGSESQHETKRGTEFMEATAKTMCNITSMLLQDK